MKWILSLEDITDKVRGSVGGKGYALSILARNRFRVPMTTCITTEAYEEFLRVTGLRGRILIELNRKEFHDMRWEEIWDASLRIRNMFLRSELPEHLREHLRHFLDDHYTDTAVVVRSSAPGEDTTGTSFAGLHESYVNVRSIDSILEHIKLVWASLWSDAALLYRRELGLEVETSSMAVVIQEIIIGDRSGVAFTQDPNDPAQAVVESVYGLNQGLVDGTVEPDRWILDRTGGRIISHAAPARDQYVMPKAEDVSIEPLPDVMAVAPPLKNEEVREVYQAALRSEELFHAPQDMEWTFRGNELFILQSRPITTISRDRGNDERGWYLSLRRSFENLKMLKKKIEQELIPEMIAEAERLARHDPTVLADEDLAAEIERRNRLYEKWVDIYWTDFIPFAHGVRLFGEVYNTAMKPEDPYEFVDLLAQTDMVGIARNRLLEGMALTVRNDYSLRKLLEKRDYADMPADFIHMVDEFLDKFGVISLAVSKGRHKERIPEELVVLILEMADHPQPQTGTRDMHGVRRRRDEFLARFSGDEKDNITQLLDLARTSYRLRDDDNIYLGRIERQMRAAVDAGRERLTLRGDTGVDVSMPGEIAHALRDKDYVPQRAKHDEPPPGHFTMKARQLVGQPAGPGVARGPARVIINPSDLAHFKRGEILVCDAVDPTKTFVVPLAAGIVERRGGMLIHGAIIAREYGLACVTGVPKVTAHVKTGDLLTVDGYLGIVTVG